MRDSDIVPPADPVTPDLTGEVLKYHSVSALSDLFLTLLSASETQGCLSVYRSADFDLSSYIYGSLLVVV